MVGGSKTVYCGGCGTYAGVTERIDDNGRTLRTVSCSVCASCSVEVVEPVPPKAKSVWEARIRSIVDDG